MKIKVAELLTHYLINDAEIKVNFSKIQAKFMKR